MYWEKLTSSILEPAHKPKLFICHTCYMQMSVSLLQVAICNPSSTWRWKYDFQKKREKKLLSLTFHRMNPVVRTGVGWLVAESSEDQVITFSASHPVPLSWRIRSVGLIVASIIARNQFIFISTQRWTQQRNFSTISSFATYKSSRYLGNGFKLFICGAGTFICDGCGKPMSTYMAPLTI